MKEVQRPEIDCATRQVSAARRLRDNGKLSVRSREHREMLYHETWPCRLHTCVETNGHPSQPERFNCSLASSTNPPRALRLSVFQAGLLGALAGVRSRCRSTRQTQTDVVAGVLHPLLWTACSRCTCRSTLP